MKNIQKPMIAGDMTGALTSELFSLSQIYCFSVQYTTSGTVSGTLTLEVSNDIIQQENSQVPTNWAPLVAPITLSTAGSIILNFDGIGSAWLRARSAVGTGVITVNLSAKG